jgi:hypothetical protein
MLRKESLNSDGQLFHQYQQIKQLPLTLTHTSFSGGRNLEYPERTTDHGQATANLSLSHAAANVC